MADAVGSAAYDTRRYGRPHPLLPSIRSVCSLKDSDASAESAWDLSVVVPLYRLVRSFARNIPCANPRYFLPIFVPGRRIRWSRSPPPCQPAIARGLMAVTVGPGQKLTVDDVCTKLRIATSTFYGWRQKGRGPRCIRLPNGSLRIRRDDFENWLTDCPCAALDPLPDLPI